MKFTTKKWGASTSAKRKATRNTATVDTSSKKAALTTKDSGGTTRWKEKAKPFSDKASYNIRVNGRLTSITGGEFCTPILSWDRNGSHTKDNSRMESSREGAR